MSELDEAGRALIALAGDAHDPTAADRARVRAALAARLGVAAGLGVGAAITATATAKAAVGATGVASTAKAMAAGATGLGSTGTATAAVTGGALATKLVVAVAITATVGVGATVKLARHASHPAAATSTLEVRGRRTAMTAPRASIARAPEQAPHDDPPVDRPAIAPAAPTEPLVPAPAHGPRLTAPAASAGAAADRPPAPAPSATSELVAPVAQQDLPAAPRETPGRAPHIETVAAPDPAAGRRAETQATPKPQVCGPAAAALETPRPAFTVADEARLVHDGVRALREGQAACALSLLDTHARYYPTGVLAEERDVERALALADLGRTLEARAVAAAFLRAHPASPLVARLRQRIPGIDAINHGMMGTRAVP